ncbi:MAG: NifU family protein [Bacilli bacterium]|nr:NifU family protein [Bacilli bacterium]
METEKKIKEIIEELRPFLNSDGGDIEFLKYENNIVYIKMHGACSNCSMLEYTLKDGIENTLKEEIPEIEAVVNVN